MTRIAVSLRHGTARIALLHGDTLAEYALWNPNQPDGVGDLHTGRITARVPAMAGSFVEIGSATGFLPDSANPADANEGTILTVRVIRAAQSGKGPRLTAAPEAPPAAKPGLLARGPGPLLDLAARFPNAQISLDDHALLAVLRPALAGRLTYAASSFDAVLEDEIATLAEPTTTLPGGAILHITPTPALTAIDIDAGAATAANTPKSHAQRAFNTALLPALARQITLRNLSGAILIDFAGMKPRQRAATRHPARRRPRQRPTAAPPARLHRPRLRRNITPPHPPALA